MMHHSSLFPIFLYESSNPRVWDPNSYCSNPTYHPYSQWTWHNCAGFSLYIDQSGISVEGPYGWTDTGNLLYVTAGDVIWIDWDGDPVISATEPTLDHAMFVTDVSGSGATRTMSNIWIAAHTTHTNSAYERLDNYMLRQGEYVDESYFAQARIRGGYYPIAQ